MYFVSFNICVYISCPDICISYLIILKLFSLKCCKRWSECKTVVKNACCEIAKITSKTFTRSFPATHWPVLKTTKNLNNKTFMTWKLWWYVSLEKRTFVTKGEAIRECWLPVMRRYPCVNSSANRRHVQVLTGRHVEIPRSARNNTKLWLQARSGHAMVIWLDRACTKARICQPLVECFAVLLRSHLLIRSRYFHWL